MLHAIVREPLTHFVLLGAALFAFNLGVEAGQLLFVAVIPAAYAILRRLGTSERLRIATAYGIGGVASFWMIDRVVGFWA